MSRTLEKELETMQIGYQELELSFNEASQRCLEAREELAALRDKFPLTYYDMLGRQLEARWNGKEDRASAQLWPPGGGAPLPLPTWEAWQWPEVKPPVRRRLDRVAALVAVDEVGLARVEAKRIQWRR